LQEQAQDIVRQEQLKILAAKADAKWASKKSYLDAPSKTQPMPALRVSDATRTGDEGVQVRVEDRNAENVSAETNETQAPEATRHPLTGREQRIMEATKEQKEKDDPWKEHARGGPSEEWQPQAWDPSALGAARR
jgi:NADH dehydrogenase [ubiquinone] 1 alpha subcomplex assembly factor 2